MEALLFLGLLCFLGKHQETKNLVLLFLCLTSITIGNYLVILYSVNLYMQIIIFCFLWQSICLCFLINTISDFNCKIYLSILFIYSLVCFIGFVYPPFTYSVYFIQQYETLLFKEIFVLSAITILSKHNICHSKEYLLYLAWFILEYRNEVIIWLQYLT